MRAKNGSKRITMFVEDVNATVSTLAAELM
jgi:hypothetical protein